MCWSFDCILIGYVINGNFTLKSVKIGNYRSFGPFSAKVYIFIGNFVLICNRH